MKHVSYIFIFLLLAISKSLVGQGVINEQAKTVYSNEQTWGLYLNSNGVGGNLRYGKHLNARNRRLYTIDFNYVSHPKEVASIIQINYTQKKFVYGKENLFWELQSQIGHQYEAYIKRDYSSIAVKLLYSGGLSLGFKKPIYYDVISINEQGYYYISGEQKFDPYNHDIYYAGKSSFFKGFDELKLIPGITAKTGIEFEYSERDPVVHALEAGISATVYPARINIMADENPQFFFFKFYIGYRFGNIIDISEASKAKERKVRRQERKEAMDGARPAAGILNL